MKKVFRVVGGMAGSSMDGLDLIKVDFWKENEKWRFEIIGEGTTIAYPMDLFERLSNATDLAPSDQQRLDLDFGLWIGGHIRSFLGEEQADVIAVHGHTLTHAPAKGISWQLGAGEQIAAQSGILTVTNFRTEDIAKGGQGAPLVPLGDFELFSDYDVCLNLGGIANLSIKGKRIAGDICPCNQVLNYYASKLGKGYDEEGEFARNGAMNLDFYTSLEANQFFQRSFPKSLPNHFLSSELLDRVTPQVGLRTYTDFIADQAAKSLTASNQSTGKLLVSGGGAFNTFLIERLKEKLSNWEVIVPSEDIVCFKEALIFGLLGLKKILGEINVLSSATGAMNDSSSGTIHHPK